MKITAIILNFLLLVTVIYLFMTKGAPNEDELFLVFVLFAAPISSLVALFVKGGDSWLSLYLKRKTLEERKKIKDLS